MTKKRIGVEEEFFAISETHSGEPQRVLLSRFAEKNNFRCTIQHSDKLPFQINKDVSGGYICIKFDSTFRTFEIATPPLSNISDLVKTLEDCWSELNHLAEPLGVSLERKGFKDIALKTSDFFEKDTVLKTITREHSGKKYFDLLYCGKISATQIHIETQKNEDFSKLQPLYKLEPLIPLLFSNSATQDNQCHRLVLLEDAFKDEYEFFGFPQVIPKNRAEYAARLERNKSCWRDYSLIAPREHGAWEFRSACIQPNFLKLKMLIAFRVAAFASLSDSSLRRNLERLDLDLACRAYREACRAGNGINVQAYLKYLHDFNIIQSIIKDAVLTLDEREQFDFLIKRKETA
jgi:hypothetical protein